MWFVWNLRRRMQRASSDAKINVEVKKLKKDFKETCYRYADNGADFAVFMMHTRTPNSKLIMKTFVEWVEGQGFNVKPDDIYGNMIRVNWKE